MRLWNRILVLLLLVSSLAVVGCSLFGDDDDDNNYSGPLTGSIKLSAEVDGGKNTFTAALRENIAGELRAATVSASDFKARVKIGAVTRLFTVVPKVVNNVANN